MKQVLELERLIMATKTFSEVAGAQDDLAALDSLRRNVSRAKKSGTFTSLVDVARYLNSSEASVALERADCVVALKAAGLKVSDVEVARGHAQRFLGATVSVGS